MAVSDVSGGVHDEAGLDVAALQHWAAENGSLADYPDVAHVSNTELLELPCDILVLAAREDQVHADNAARLDTNWSPRARTARPRPRRTRSWPNVASSSCPTS